MYYINFNFVKTGTAIGVFLLLTIPSYYTRGQSNDKIDSLNTVLETADGIEKCDVLFSLYYQHIRVDHNVSLQYGIQAYELARVLGDSFRIVKGGRYLGQAYRRIHNLESSLASFNAVIRIAQRNRTKPEIFEEYQNILNGIASTYLFFADYEKALGFYLKALEIHEQEGDKAEISIVLNNIGLVYFKLRDYKSALRYYEQALAFKMESGDFYDLDRLYINTGLCFNQLKDYEQSRKNFEAAFNVCKENCSDAIEVEGNFGLGVANHGQKNFEKAIRHFERSYEIAKATGYSRFVGENLVYLAKINIAQENFRAAIPQLAEAEKIIAEAKYNELLIDIYRQYSIVYNHLEDYQNASVYQTKYIELKDTVYNADLFGDLAKIQSNFAERENIRTIADKEHIIQQQRNFNIAIVIIAVLAGLLVFVLYRSNRTKKKVNQALSEAKTIIEDQNRQLLSRNYSLNQELHDKNIELEKANEQLQRVNEELDNFIYKTSHDIRGPLASLKGMCNVALMDVKDALALGYLQKLDITAEKLNTILTRLLIVNQINNSTLASERIDFKGIVNDVLTLEKKKGLPPRLTVTKKIADDIAYHSDHQFVRIIMENLIDNAIKFYNDSIRVEPFVNIEVILKNNHVRIRVVDNGIGISQVHPDKIFQMFSRASERSETGGIGLYITKTATEKLGGSVHLGTTAEGYTEFYVDLPLEPVRVMA